MRYSIIDGFRGYFLFVMMVVHLNFFLGGRAGQINHHRLGLVEDAQGFVFVSGLVIGIVYGRMLLRGPQDRMRRALHGRMRTVFGHHAALILAITVLAAGLGAGLGAAAPPIYDRFGQAPLLYGLLTLGLMAGPEYIDILPMYLVFMALTPVALAACARGHHLAVLAASAAVWTFAQTGLTGVALHAIGHGAGLDLQGIELGLYLNRLGWQLLYFFGLVAGMAFAQGRLDLSALADPKWKPVFLVALLAVLGFALLGLLKHVAPGRLPAAFHAAAARPEFAVLRAANFAADLVVVVWLLAVGATSSSRIWRVCGRGLHRAFTWRPLVFLGQHSLHVYSFHVIAIYLFLTFVDYRGLPRIWREVIPFLGGLSLFLPAWLHARSLSRETRAARPAGAGDGGAGGPLIAPGIAPVIAPAPAGGPGAG